MIGRHFASPSAGGASPLGRARHARPPLWEPGGPACPLAFLAAILQPYSFAPAVDAAGRAFHSATFWSVLAVLLGAGCGYYLVRWFYERRITQQQENLHKLYALSETILDSHDPGSVQKEVAEASMLVADGTHAYVLILDSSAQQLEYVVGTEAPPLSAVSLSAISGAVTCFRSQALTEVPDAENCPFVKTDIVRRLGQKALLYVPIMAGGSCLGVIEVEDRSRKRIFSRQQKTRVQHVARLAALGLRLGDQRSVQAHLHRTQKMAAVSELIEGVSETLVTPLRRLGELAGGSSGEDNPGDAVTRLREMASEARRAVSTVERLAQLARSRRGNLQQVDIHQLLEGVRERWVEDGRSLSLNLSRAPARVTADPDHLEQVLLNLLQHGEQLLEGIGGRSLQASTNLFERNVVVSLGPAGGVESGDPEPHMADEDRLLEPESSLRLAVCQNLVEGFGGTLRVENRAKRGFRIELRYPLAADALPRNKPAAPLHARDGISRPITVLVIDPDTAVQDALLYLLTDRGYRVVPVSTAEEGIDLCEHARFDWVLCDAQVSGEGGVSVYERVRAEVDHFVFLADAAMAVENGHFSGEGRAVLLKPIEATGLDGLLQSLAPEPEIRESEAQSANV